LKLPWEPAGASRLVRRAQPGHLAAVLGGPGQPPFAEHLQPAVFQRTRRIHQPVGLAHRQVVLAEHLQPTGIDQRSRSSPCAPAPRQALPAPRGAARRGCRTGPRNGSAASRRTGRTNRFSGWMAPARRAAASAPDRVDRHRPSRRSGRGSHRRDTFAEQLLAVQAGPLAVAQARIHRLVLEVHQRRARSQGEFQLRVGRH
jgi:hypothetical protein